MKEKNVNDYLSNDNMMNIFSFLHFSILTKVRGVCTDWKRLSDVIIDKKYNKPAKVAFKDNSELRKTVLDYYKLKYDESDVPRGQIYNEYMQDFYEEAEGLPSNNEFNFLDRSEEIVVKYGWPINKWNVSEVRDLSGIFQQLYKFDEPICSWNVSNATNMCYMFHKAWCFNQDISSWDTSNVEYMQSMFHHAANFNHAISSWNVSNVICMDDMFKGATDFNQDLRSWDISKVEEVSGFAFEAYAFDDRLLPQFDEGQIWP